ncbi:carbon-nitrogen hydrolase family protein [Gulosibacter chungangensis]|uniref:carbon-nitrogen hydrolase family protein n=1 Tax=Gulosibacter chungangensis TaxID=979746 RepID=UPI001CE3CA0D|nr:carbon-nitrogen hydrolase family protein [Gulosibacter chungangensis]
MTKKTLTVALAQRAPHPIDRPLDAFARDVAATVEAHPNIQLLVYPELHLNGTEHLPEPERADALEAAAVTLDSDYIRTLGAIAAEHGIWLCPGSLGERGPAGEFFNTQLLFDGTGALRSRYRKMFPWRPYEPHQPGTEFITQGLDGTAIAGLSICYDAWFPEHTRQLAWDGADLILNIVKTTTPDREQELVLARANAIVNQNVMASVNCAPPVGRGRSIVVNAEGFVIAEAGIGEETLVFEFDPAHVAAVRERGTMFSNRMWSQFQEGDAVIPMPLYDGRIDPKSWTPRSR